jgi:predicted unusual protein kinase regulating ubiquinone biosynthesis (AarF/ABC1/UbiB family)
MNSDQFKNKASINSIKTGTIERNIALTRLGLGAGAKIAAHSIANIFRGGVDRDDANREFYENQARILADELGKLKGSVMKAGQMLSLYGQYFLPEEAVNVLSQLQDNTPPVHWKVVFPVLKKSLGRSRLAELEIEEHPIAAASLGQAHRAWRKKDRMPLCIKIQYPGVATSIDSDLRTLSRVLKMTRFMPKGPDLDPVFSELREMLMREVDYRAERRFTENFAQRLSGDARYAVPRVMGDYCSDMVLTTSFEEGVSVREEIVHELSQERRNQLGLAFFELFLKEYFEWGMVQTDPHFGNYRVRPDGKGGDQLVLLDFGATRMFDPKFVRAYADLVRGAVEHDHQRLWAGGRGIGLLSESMPAPVLEAFAKMCELIVEPFNDHSLGGTPSRLLNDKGEYLWGESDLPMRVGKLAAMNSISYHFKVPPREIMFLHRRLAGVFIVMATLRAEINVRELLLAHLRAASSA